MAKVVVTGVGGMQQAEAARAFRAAGWEVAGTSRGGAGGALAADLETGEGLEAAFRGADAVAFTMPQDHRDGVAERIAEAVARAAGRAGVGRVVLNLAGRSSPPGETIFRKLEAVVAAVMGGQAPAVTLEPTVFMDNLGAPWSVPAILEGTFAYPAPEEAPVAWISHRSLGQAMVAAATAPVLGRRVAIGGAEALTGPEVAEVLSAVLARPVAYARIPLPDFRAGIDAAFGPPAGDRIGELYAELARNPRTMETGAEGMAELGVVPERLTGFLARQDWARAAAA